MHAIRSFCRNHATSHGRHARAFGIWMIWMAGMLKKSVCVIVGNLSLLDVNSNFLLYQITFPTCFLVIFLQPLSKRNGQMNKQLLKHLVNAQRSPSPHLQRLVLVLQVTFPVKIPRSIEMVASLILMTVKVEVIIGILDDSR